MDRFASNKQIIGMAVNIKLGGFKFEAQRALKIDGILVKVF